MMRYTLNEKIPHRVKLLLTLIVALCLWRWYVAVRDSSHWATCTVHMEGRWWVEQRERLERMRSCKEGMNGMFKYIGHCMSDWKCDKVLDRALRQYRQDNPSSTVEDGKIFMAIRNAKLKPQDEKDSVEISVPSESDELSIAVANAYAMALCQHIEDENRRRADKALSAIHAKIVRARCANETNALPELIAQEADMRKEVGKFDEILVISQPAKRDN